MDFSDEGSNTLIIHGQSHIDKNSIVIVTETENEKNHQLISFKKTEGLSMQSFEIEKIKGNHKVTFIFLPGSNFDFSWFRFSS
jgi:beta-galactosidase